MTSGRRFTVRQGLVLDDWKCGDRLAEMVLAARLLDDGSFSVTVVSTYVDTGWGDSWGCRDKMWNALDAAALDTAGDLELGLEKLVALTFPNHPPRYYFYPGWGVTEFDLAGGGQTSSIDQVFVP
jgi:hypothetical protein